MVVCAGDKWVRSVPALTATPGLRCYLHLFSLRLQLPEPLWPPEAPLKHPPALRNPGKLHVYYMHVVFVQNRFINACACRKMMQISYMKIIFAAKNMTSNVRFHKSRRHSLKWPSSLKSNLKFDFRSINFRLMGAFDSDMTPNRYLSPQHTWLFYLWQLWADSWPRSQQCIPTALASVILSLKVGPFSSRPPRGGEQAALIHHSVAQPPQEVVNMVDLWNGHSCLGCTKWRLRRDMENISHRFITKGDISRSANQSICRLTCLFCASRFFLWSPEQLGRTNNN